MSGDTFKRWLSQLSVQGRSYGHTLKKADKSVALVGVILLIAGGYLALGGRLSPLFGDEPVELRILRSNDDRPYALFADELAARLRARHLVKVTNDRGTTTGSVDSLSQVDEPETAGDGRPRGAKEPAKNKRNFLAIVQADVAYYYIRGGHPQFMEAHASSSVRTIARLFEERLELSFVSSGKATENATDTERSTRNTVRALPAHCRPGAPLEQCLLSFEDVCALEPSSGTMFTTRNVGRLLGASWKNFQACHELNVLNANGVGFSSKSDATNSTYGFEGSSVRVIVGSLRPGIYKESPVGRGFTVAWHALLVTNKDLDDRIVREVRDVVSQIAADCRESVRLGRPQRLLCQRTNIADVKEDERTKELPVALHPAILMDELDGFSRAIAILTDGRILKAIVISLLGLALFASAWPNLRPAVRQGRSDAGLFSQLALLVVSTRGQWLRMLLLMASLHVLVGILVWLSELHAQALSSDVSFVTGGLGMALDWAMKFAFKGGESSIELQSTLALALVALLKVGWTLASAALLAGLVSVGKSVWRIWQMREQVVIVGLNQRAQELVRELDRENVGHRMLLSRELPELEKDSFGDVDSCAPDQLRDYVKDALALKPRALVVLGDYTAAENEKQGDVDTWVCRHVLMASQLRSAAMPMNTASQRSERDPRFRILAEVEHEANIALVRAAGADEVICVRKFGTGLLAQAAAKPGLLHVFEDLFETEPESQEIYIDPLLPADIARYRSFERALRLYPLRHPRRIPLGIQRATGALLNPRGVEARLRSADQLLVMADSPLSRADTVPSAGLRMKWFG